MRAGHHDVVQRLQGLCHGSVAIEAVDLVEVDVDGAEPSQRQVDLLHDRRVRQASPPVPSPTRWWTVVASTMSSRRVSARALPTISAEDPVPWTAPCLAADGFPPPAAIRRRRRGMTFVHPERSQTQSFGLADPWPVGEPFTR